MDIRFTSTLTADDEARLAPALMQALTALVGALPIAYTLRMETLGGTVLQQTHPIVEGMADGAPSITARHARHNGVDYTGIAARTN